jgi:hypothetical protein
MGIVNLFGRRTAQSANMRNKRKQRDLDRDKSLDNIGRRPTPPGMLPKDWKRPGPVWVLWKCKDGYCVEKVEESTDHNELNDLKTELEGALLPEESLVIFNLGG